MQRKQPLVNRGYPQPERAGMSGPVARAQVKLTVTNVVF